MTPAAKPRRWTIRYHGYKDELGAASLFAQNWPEFESDIEIIEASAYDAIEKQLEIERRKVERLKSILDSELRCLSQDRKLYEAKQKDYARQLKAIDKGEG